jgi:hypothetical protein
MKPMLASVGMMTIKPANKTLLVGFSARPPFYTKNLSIAFTSMDYEYDTYEYETLQDEIALEMASEALLEQNILAYADQALDAEFDEELYDDDPYDEWEEVERRETVGIEAYAHWNEDARLMWWMEEGRFG